MGSRDEDENELSVRKEQKAAKRFKRAQNMINKCEFYWGSLLEDQLENVLNVTGLGLITDAPRSKKNSLRWYLCHRKADGIQKIEMKYIMRELHLLATKERLSKYIDRTKMNPVKRPEVIETSDILEEKRADRMIGVYGMGEVSTVIFGLKKGRGIEALMIRRMAANDNEMTQWTADVLTLLTMGNTNIQRLWGVSFFDDSFGIVLENVAVKLEELVSIKSRLPEWTRQLHSALLFLEQSQFVHYRLNLDSCFLSFSFQLKLAIFCLGDGVIVQEIQLEETAACRWVPWESLAGSYNLKSVVWTYGTILWSIYNSGAIPYEDLTEDQIKDVEFRKDYELESTDSLPSNVQEVVDKCWLLEEDRPSLFRLKHLVDKIVE